MQGFGENVMTIMVKNDLSGKPFTTPVLFDDVPVETLQFFYENSQRDLAYRKAALRSLSDRMLMIFYSNLLTLVVATGYGAYLIDLPGYEIVKIILLITTIGLLATTIISLQAIVTVDDPESDHDSSRLFYYRSILMQRQIHRKFLSKSCQLLQNNITVVKSILKKKQHRFRNILHCLASMAIANVTLILLYTFFA